MAPLINNLDQVIHMHALGLETSENVETYGDVWMSLLQEPGARTWWDAVNGLALKESFRYVDERLRAGQFPPPISTVMRFANSGASAGDDR